MGTPSGSSSRWPPDARRAHLHSQIFLHHSAKPTGPHNLQYSDSDNFVINNSDFSDFRHLELNTPHPYSLSVAPQRPRVRPRYWKILCKNTVPYDQEYPPLSSRSSNPYLCARGLDCHYGHHGDVYLDAMELGQMSYESGIAVALGAGIDINSIATGWNNRPTMEIIERRDYNTRGRSEYDSDVNGVVHMAQESERWRDRRIEWRKRQASLRSSGDYTYKSPKWEDRYKSRNSRGRSENKRPCVGGIDENEWGEYTARRRGTTPVNERVLPCHWDGSKASHGQGKQDSHGFENGLKELSRDYSGGPSSRVAHRRGGAANTQSTEVTHDQRESTSSGETTSTVQFIIPPFQKGIKPFRKTSVHSPLRQHTVPTPYPISPTHGLANFPFDPSASSFNPISPSNVQHPWTDRFGGAPGTASTHQPSREFTSTPRRLSPSQLVTQSPGGGQLYSAPPNAVIQWDLVRNVLQHHPGSSSRTHQQPTIWMPMETYKLYIEQGRRLPNIEHKLYENRTPTADYGERVFRPAERPVQNLHRARNTFIVQSQPSYPHPQVQNAAPLHPQHHLNHAFNQMKTLLSLYPECSNKTQANEVLTKLLVPDTLEDIGRGPSCKSESLQTALHRLALTITQEEHEVVARFQAEMWAVLAWLGEGGGSVAILKREDIGAMEDAKNVGIASDAGGDMEPGASVTGAGIKLSSGQFTIHGADEHHKGYNEVVALTAGQPAVLAPVFPAASVAHASNLHMPTVIVNGAPIVLTKSNATTKGTGYYKQIPQPLPATSVDEVLVPLSLSSANPPIPTQAYERYTQDAIKFFLSDKMESYLQDSYDKVLRVQTIISLKWRRVSKVFEREWCAGISRYARNGIVLRAFWNVYAMEETDWLYEEDPASHSDIPHMRGRGNYDQSTNRSSSTESGATERPIPVGGGRYAEDRTMSMGDWDTYSPTSSWEEFNNWDAHSIGTSGADHKSVYAGGNLKGKAKEVYNDTWEPDIRLPQRAVWDRRGLCQEVEPVALSNEPRHFLELVEKICLKKVMNFSDIRDVTEYLHKLPPPPEVRLFRSRDFLDPPDMAHATTIESESWNVPLVSDRKNSPRQREWSSSDDWSRYKPVDSSPAAPTWESNESSQRRGRSRKRSSTKNHTRSSTVVDLRSKDEYGVEIGTNSSKENILPYLIDALGLEPRIIESPVLNPIFNNSGPLYYTGNPCIADGIFYTEENKIEARARAKHLEMCHLDRALFMGYIVLEILSIWEEQRGYAARVRWKFPEVDKEAWVGEKIKQLAEENLRLAKERRGMVVQETELVPAAPPPPTAPAAPLAPIPTVPMATPPAVPVNPPPAVPVAPTRTSAPNWAEVARGKGIVEQKRAPPTVQAQIRPSAAVAVAQSAPVKQISNEGQPPTTATPQAVVNTPSRAPPNQPDFTPKAQKQAEVVIVPKQAPGPKLSAAPSSLPNRSPGAALLYTDILKMNTGLKQEQPNSLGKVQPVPLPVSPPHAPAPGVVKATTDTTGISGDDAAVWQMYKSKKEKNRHSIDLQENNHQKWGTVRTRTPASTSAPTTPAMRNKTAEVTPKIAATRITTPCSLPKVSPIPPKLDVTPQKETTEVSQWPLLIDVTPQKLAAKGPPPSWSSLPDVTPRKEVARAPPPPWPLKLDVTPQKEAAKASPWPALPDATPQKEVVGAPPTPVKLDVTPQKPVAKEEVAKMGLPLALPPSPLHFNPAPEAPKPPTLRDLEILVDKEIEAEKEKLRRWFSQLQTFLWTYNEGVGVDFFEITDDPDWDTGFSEAVSSSHGDLRGGMDCDCGRSEECFVEEESLNGSPCRDKRKIHRGGARNKHTLWKREMGEKVRGTMHSWDIEKVHMAPHPQSSSSRPGAWMSGALSDEADKRWCTWGWGN